MKSLVRRTATGWTVCMNAACIPDDRADGFLRVFREQWPLEEWRLVDAYTGIASGKSGPAFASSVPPFLLRNFFTTLGCK
jgi:hypothetical protein